MSYAGCQATKDVTALMDAYAHNMDWETKVQEFCQKQKYTTAQTDFLKGALKDGFISRDEAKEAYRLFGKGNFFVNVLVGLTAQQTVEPLRMRLQWLHQNCKKEEDGGPMHAEIDRLNKGAIESADIMAALSNGKETSHPVAIKALGGFLSSMRAYLTAQEPLAQK